MTPDQKKELVRLIRKYARAEVAFSWKGSQPPEDVKEIEQEALQAKTDLFRYIDSLTEVPK